VVLQKKKNDTEEDASKQSARSGVAGVYTL
jgi:hypothetical protein